MTILENTLTNRDTLQMSKDICQLLNIHFGLDNAKVLDLGQQNFNIVYSDINCIVKIFKVDVIAWTLLVTVNSNEIFKCDFFNLQNLDNIFEEHKKDGTLISELLGGSSYEGVQINQNTEWGSSYESVQVDQNTEGNTFDNGYKWWEPESVSAYDTEDSDEQTLNTGSRFSDEINHIQESIVPCNIQKIRVVALIYNNEIIAYRFKTDRGAFDMRKSVATKYGLGGFKTEKSIILESVNGLLMSSSEHKAKVCVPDISGCSEDCQRLVDALYSFQ